VRFVVDKVALVQVFSEYFDFPHVSIIPSILHTHLRLRVALTAKTNWRSLRDFQKKMHFRKSGSIGERYTLLFLVSEELATFRKARCKAEATQSATLCMLCMLCTLCLLRSLHQVATLAAIGTRQPRKVTDFFYRHLYKILVGRLPWESDDSDDYVLLLYAVGNKRERKLT